MAIDSFVRAAALAFLCLLPAAGRWWSGRSLLALLDDPVLPERLLAHRRRNLAVLWAVIVCTLLLGRVSDLFWSLPLIVVTRVAAGYPLRRALFDEHWSLVAYVMTMLRLLLAVGGLWLLLACTPLLASAAGSYDWLVALALGAVLLLWNDRSAEVFRWFVRSEPFRDEALLVRFQAMAAASGAPQPRFELVDLGGGAIANAVALASLRGSSILYTDTLLRLLDSDEAAAITAHEIAHLEHFDTMRLRRLNRTMSALILAAMCAALLPRLVPGMSLLMLAALWCGAVVVTLGWMARDRQRNETASDLRAVELSGQPDALVQALTKLYTFSRVPRRWDTQMERMASHPSLARRIRSIREAAGAPQVPALLQPETVRSRDGRTLITFDCERLHWQESEGVTHVLPYALLTELRVHARPAGGTRLMALERGGRRWEVALEAAEAARAQALLDQVDVRLAEPVVHSQSVHVLQVAGAIVAVCAMWAGHILVAFVALGASVRSAAAFSAAAGGAALGAAGIVGRQAIATGAGDGGWPALPLAVFGVALLVGAWRQREEDATRVVDLGVAGLALLTLLCLTLIATRGGNAVQLYQASLAIPSGAILPLALAAALTCRRRRAWQLAAIPVGTVGLMVGIAGSGTFLHAFGHDPFLVAGQLLPVEALTQSPVDEFTLPMAVSDLRLSPGGRQVAVLTRDVAVGVVATFSVGAPGTQFTRFPANDLLFLDDERMLTVAPDGADTVLREVTLQPRAVVWERRIDDLQHGRLAYRRDSGRWLLTGPSFDGRIVVVEGKVGTADVQRREWNSAGGPGWADVWAVDGDSVLLAQKEFDLDQVAGGAWSWTMMVMLDQMPTRLTRITPNGATEIATSQLDTSCSDRVLDLARLVCMAFDGTRTHLFVLDPAGGMAQPIGSLAGRFVSYRPTREGWLSGWINSGWIDSTQLAVDVVSRRAIGMPRELRAGELTVAGRVAATLTHGASSTHVRLYRLDER